jgi:AmmeMemoRadiSam system protein A
MKELLDLARETLEAYFKGKQPEVSEDIKKNFSEKKACFVTLTIKEELRGCVGSLEARQELWKDVIENSINAAFNDSRFPKLTLEELVKIKIEISILSIPKRILFANVEELKEKIGGKGVIIKKGWNSATYLPQVWEEIHDEEEFLESLCQKAGLNMNAWKEKGLEIWIYEVKKIKEK